MTSKTTAAMIRSKLNLRFQRREDGNSYWEVYTTYSGGLTFKWLVIPDHEAMWYFHTFDGIRTRMSDEDLVAMLNLLEEQKKNLVRIS